LYSKELQKGCQSFRIGHKKGLPFKIEGLGLQ